MAIGAPGPRTGSAYWTSGAAGLGTAADVGRVQATAKALGSLKAPEGIPVERDTLELGRPQDPAAGTYGARKAEDPTRPNAGEAPRDRPPAPKPPERPPEKRPEKPPGKPPEPPPTAAGGKDADGDGVISPAERLAYLTRHPALDPRDLNLDGTVSPAEAQAEARARPAAGGGLDITA